MKKAFNRKLPVSFSRIPIYSGTMLPGAFNQGYKSSVPPSTRDRHISA